MSEWIKTAKVGDKVVCIDGKRTGGYGDEIVPQVGIVYTIREVSVEHDGVVFLLTEITNMTRPYNTVNGVQNVEACFNAKVFRPAESKPTDISIFTDMLKTKETELA